MSSKQAIVRTILLLWKCFKIEFYSALAFVSLYHKPNDSSPEVANRISNNGFRHLLVSNPD